MSLRLVVLLDEKPATMSLDILERGNRTNQPVHIINVEIKDNHEEAAIGGQVISQIASKVGHCLPPRMGKSNHVCRADAGKHRSNKCKI